MKDIKYWSTDYLGDNNYRVIFTYTLYGKMVWSAVDFKSKKAATNYAGKIVNLQMQGGVK